MDFSHLKKECAKYLQDKDIVEIEKAYNFAKDAHGEQRRKSGEPYIAHPVHIAYTLAEMRLDRETIVAALLHDVPEDTPITMSIVEQYFGASVAELVDGVTKLGKVRLRNSEERQAENIRKMVLAMAKDVRIILIKLADRLHNMQTISALPPHKQRGIATETLEIYAPLAHRLGISSIKWQLEDLCFAVLHPDQYAQIRDEVQEKRKNRELHVQAMVSELETHLHKEKIQGNISGRAKHLYGIYKNVFIKKKDTSVATVLDGYGLRIIVDSIPQCYQVLGIVHAIWHPLTNRLKDFIAVPKSNGYQSLHTGVITDKGLVVEIQIRTYDMHYIAEYGLAAHWRYKGRKALDEASEQKITWINQLLDWQKEMKDASEFVESLKMDLFEDEIFVFTPKGDVFNLPKDATPIDFAYLVHSGLGNRCVGCKVNGRMVQLDRTLQSGDIVEILTSKVARGPSRNWLEFVTTTSARNKIKKWFKLQHREGNILSGKELLDVELKKVWAKSLTELPQEKITQTLEYFQAKNIEDLYALIGYGTISIKKVVDRLVEKEKSYLSSQKTTKKASSKKVSRDQVRIEGIGELLVRMAHCCEPQSGDAIVGFVTRGKGVTVHKRECSTIQQEMIQTPERIVKADWESDEIAIMLVPLDIVVKDKMGLLKSIVTVISDAGINISKIGSKKLNDQETIVKLELEISDNHQLSDILRKIQDIPHIIRIER